MVDSKKSVPKRIKNGEEVLRLKWIETDQHISDYLGYNIKILDIKKTPRKSTIFFSIYPIRLWMTGINI